MSHSFLVFVLLFSRLFFYRPLMVFFICFFDFIHYFFFFQLNDSAADVEVPQSFFSSEELKTLIEQTKPDWVPASEYFDPKTAATGKIGRGGLFVEEPVTGTRLRRLNNGNLILFTCILRGLG